MAGYLLFLLLALIIQSIEGVSTLDHHRYRRETSGFNEYLDRLLVNVRKYIVEYNLEQYKLKKDVLNVHLDGLLNGISSIRRVGDSKVTTLPDLKLQIDGLFGLDNIQCDMDWKAHLLLLKPEGKVGASIEKTTFTLRLLVDIHHGEVKVMSIKTKSIGHVKTTFKSPIETLPIIHNIANVVSNAVTNFMKDSIAYILEGPIKKLVQQEINKIELPNLSNLGNL